MKQLVVLSGKGGTGKTSLVASFARLSGKVVAVDCDVDAANLALLMPGDDLVTTDFFSGRRAAIDGDRCRSCGACAKACRFGAIRPGEERLTVDQLACEGCGVCALVCPAEAIAFHPNQAGSWQVRQTESGPLVHARLGIAQSNSGKLEACVRDQARTLAEAGGFDRLLIDGPPGIGCPVHAALGGVDLAVVVTEPTAAGQHDLERILQTIDHFHVPAAVLINKWNLSAQRSAQIEAACSRHGTPVLGRIPFDPEVPHQLSRGRLPLAASRATARAVRESWEKIAVAAGLGCI